MPGTKVERRGRSSAEGIQTTATGYFSVASTDVDQQAITFLVREVHSLRQERSPTLNMDTAATMAHRPFVN